MSANSGALKNYARGSGGFHKHRLSIVRTLLEDPAPPGQRSDFLRNSLFELRPGAWTVFPFGSKDWDLCDRLIEESSPELEVAMLALVIEYLRSNLPAVARLDALSARMSTRLLQRHADDGEPPDPLSATDAQSLFALRAQCAGNQRSTEAMNVQLRTILGPGWARSRLSYPLMYHFAAHPPARMLDSFLSYVLTGEEKPAERLALKLMLNGDAGVGVPLPFKLYLGLMGHPYDALEFALDHFEEALSSERGVPPHLARFVDEVSAMLPGSRAERLSRFANGKVSWADRADPSVFAADLFLTLKDAFAYAAITETGSIAPSPDDPMRPLAILTNMRATPYPAPREFQYVTADAATWTFVEGGRLITALLRSMFMIDRDDNDIEARDAMRLVRAFGSVTPLTAAAPSGMLLLRRLATTSGILTEDPVEIERRTDKAIRSDERREDRTWINVLQWDLRRLAEAGRTEEWLHHVRAETKLRPSYLTGIDWGWVEQIIELHRLRPFRSFDGAFLFIHMELEHHSDPLRLRLVLDPLLKDIDFDEAVERIVSEFGVAAPAIVRRYLTTQNMLASGQAPNYVAALDQRVRALEACIKSHGFTPLLTEEAYDEEVRTLTAELLLSDVNAGKFEVPWATFRKDANSSHEDLLLAVDSLRSRPEGEVALTELTETPISFPNGKTERYKVRQRDRAVFSLVIDLLKFYMQHPAFGLEVILSGRFRHNNLLQELWAELAETNDAMIPGVTAFAQGELIEQYRQAAEMFVDGWCSANMQTKRPDKKKGLFDLVPTQKELDDLIALADARVLTTDVVDVVIQWIKDKLRTQVADARETFSLTFRLGLEKAFAKVRDDQLALLNQSRTIEANYRQLDVTKVHVAANDAVLRRVETLAGWFDGVDAQPTETISLADLSLAVETLFENMISGRTLVVEIDELAKDILFRPEEVKIAFDLLREIYFNALRHGVGTSVRLEVVSSAEEGGAAGQPVTYVFANGAKETNETGEESFAGNRYTAATDAVTREGNSGRAKIAASAATLIGCDTAVLCVRTKDKYMLEVPLRADALDEAA